MFEEGCWRELSVICQIKQIHFHVKLLIIDRWKK